MYTNSFVVILKIKSLLLVFDAVAANERLYIHTICIYMRDVSSEKQQHYMIWDSMSMHKVHRYRLRVCECMHESLSLSLCLDMRVYWCVPHAELLSTLSNRCVLSNTSVHHFNVLVPSTSLYSRFGVCFFFVFLSFHSAVYIETISDSLCMFIFFRVFIFFTSIDCYDSKHEL